MHFTWFEYLFKIDAHYVYAAASIFSTVVIFAFCAAARVSLGSGEAAILPATKFSIRGIAEALTEFMAGLCEMLLGHSGAKFLPHFGAIFTFILFCNLIGLIPGLAAATSDINCAFAVGIVSFVFYNAIGLATGGLHYLAHFLGPFLPLAPLMLPIELISHLVRPLSLGMRLSINMTADHTILGTFVELTYVVVPVIFYVMGSFVSVLQAFVFTMLSMVYVMLATAEDH